MKKNYRGICLIGAGRAGMIHARNFQRSVPGFRIVSVADPMEEAAASACRELEIEKYYLDYKQALEDEETDAVVIVSPTKYHCEIAVCAAKHRKDILLEKPMAMNARECVQIMEAVKDSGVKLQIGFMRRFDESFQAAKKAVEAGEIGSVVLVKSLTRGPSTPRPWMYDIKKAMVLWRKSTATILIPCVGFLGASLSMCTRSPEIIVAMKPKRNFLTFMTTWC